MDAPPELEASLPFVQIGQWMKKSGINVPEIHQHDLELGFMILSDFGNFHFQDALVTRDRESLYKLATDQIIQFQSSLPDSEKSLPKNQFHLVQGCLSPLSLLLPAFS